MKPKILALILAVALGGCGSPKEVAITKTCSNENYTVGYSSPGGRIDVRERIYRGRRCINCGGIHNPVWLGDLK